MSMSEQIKQSKRISCKRRVKRERGETATGAAQLVGASGRWNTHANPITTERGRALIFLSGGWCSLSHSLRLTLILSTLTNSSRARSRPSIESIRMSNDPSYHLLVLLIIFFCLFIFIITILFIERSVYVRL